MSDYLDSVTGEGWFIFGEHPDGCVDLNDGANDIFAHITRDQAERLIAIRDEFLAKVRAEYDTMPRRGRDQSDQGAGLPRMLAVDPGREPGVVVAPALCSACAKRMVQANAEGKIGIVVCDKCAARVNPPEPVHMRCYRCGKHRDSQTPGVVGHDTDNGVRQWCCSRGCASP